MTVLTANAPDDRVDRLDLGKVVLLRNADVQDATGHVLCTAERGVGSATNFDEYKTFGKNLLCTCIQNLNRLIEVHCHFVSLVHRN